MSKPGPGCNDTKGRTAALRLRSCARVLCLLCALPACSRTSEPAASKSDALQSTPPTTPPASAASGERPSPRYVVSGARVVGTERSAQTDAALSAVRRHVHGLMPCYVGALEQQPTLAGSIALELTVDPTGAFSEIDLKAKKDALEPVIRCAFATLSVAQVALPADVVTAPLRMHYDLAFSPAPANATKSATIVESGPATAAPK